LLSKKEILKISFAIPTGRSAFELLTSSHLLGRQLLLKGCDYSSVASSRVNRENFPGLAAYGGAQKDTGYGSDTWTRGWD
jgi:hypothetical protein